MMSFPTVSAHTCNTRKLAKPYFNAYSISSGHSYLLDVVCCCARELPVAWSPLDTIVFINRNVLFYTKEALLFALGKKGKKGEKLGECEATIKRRTDRPFKSKKMMKTWRKYSNDIKTRIKIWTARIKISKESIEAHAHKNSR